MSAILCECIYRYKTNNRMVLIDRDYNTLSLPSPTVKEFIENGKIEVVNCKVTDNHRLVNIIPTKNVEYNRNSRMIKEDVLISKYRLLGYTSIEIATTCRHKIYVLRKFSEAVSDYIVIIPDDVVEVVDGVIGFGALGGASKEMCMLINDRPGTVRFIGGRNLVTLNGLFQNLRATVLNLTMLVTNNVEAAEGAFNSCTADQIVLGNFNTKKLTSTNSMFRDCETKSINLEILDTSNVTNMNYMFEWARISKLDLSRLNTSNVTKMEAMFKGCATLGLDLRSFDTRKVENMKFMFSSNDIDELDISSFDTSKVKDFFGIFEACGAVKVTASNKFVVKNSARCSEDSFKYIPYIINMPKDTRDKLIGSLYHVP